MDADASLRTQVTNTVRACFSALCQIRSVRRALPQHALLTLVRTLVITRLDPCNSVLAGISGYLQDQDRLQSVLNASAWLVYSRRTSEHTTTALGTARVTRTGANPVPVVCPGVSLCAWHNTGVFNRIPAADIRRSSPSTLCRLTDVAGAVNSLVNPR